MAWDVLSGAAKMAWDVLSGVTKLHGMFCPGWQIDAGCFVRGVKKRHGMFCPGMFCPTFLSQRPRTFQIVISFFPYKHIPTLLLVYRLVLSSDNHTPTLKTIALTL